MRVLQYSIALMLLATSVGKLLDVPGFADVLLTFKLFPEATVFAFALGLSLFELFLSLWLFSGIWLKFAAVVAILLHAQFTFINTISNIRGLDIPNCGCFGVFWARPMSWGKVAEDAFVTGLCVVLFVLARRLEGRPGAGRAA
jgi:hypothetical protein